MAKIIIQLNCPQYYDLFMTCHAHGWKNLAPFYWDSATNTLKFALIEAKVPIAISVSQRGNILEAELKTDTVLNSAIKLLIKKHLRRSLCLDIDTSNLLKIAEKVGAEYADLVRRGAGRPLRAPTLWEDAAKTLFTTNCSWSLTKKMCESACSKKFVACTPSGSFPFPDPEIFVNYENKELKKLMPVGYRAEYFLLLAKRFAKDPNLKNLEKDNLNYHKALQIVNELKGFGPYACRHLLILAGHYDDIPIDTVVISYLKKIHRVRKPKSFIKRHYQTWGHYKWWGFKLEKMINRMNWLGD